MNNGSKRWDWLTTLIRQRGYSYGVEIGVRKGTNCAKLLNSRLNLRMVGVDPLCPLPDAPGGAEYLHADFELLQHHVQKVIDRYKDRFDFRQMTSAEASVLFTNETFDFVFIDGDHSYEGCRDDITRWSPLVKKGGIICGHDIHFPGVFRAVAEVLPDFKCANVDHVWYKEILV